MDRCYHLSMRWDGDECFCRECGQRWFMEIDAGGVRRGWRMER